MSHLALWVCAAFPDDFEKATDKAYAIVDQLTLVSFLADA